MTVLDPGQQLSHQPYDWQAEIRRWPGFRRGHPSDLAHDAITFFQLVFQHTRCPHQAWFGVHPSAMSLVVGGIFLAAILRTGEDRGVWLLVDQQPPTIEGLGYRPVKSTQNSRFPLIWGHSASLTVLSILTKNPAIWASFARASEKILHAKRVASDRDSVQVRRGKRRLSEFWPATPLNLFPDEIDEATIFREGAKRQVTVNAYERDSRARQRCIQHYGARCFICGFAFGEFYGEIAEGFIHVHHLRPLADVGEEYIVDPLEDLRPVCPNCHAVLHLRKPAFSVEEVIELVHNMRRS